METYRIYSLEKIVKQFVNDYIREVSDYKYYIDPVKNVVILKIYSIDKVKDESDITEKNE